MARNFDGVGDYITHNVGLVTREPVTMAAWFRAASVHKGTLLSATVSGSPSRQLSLGVDASSKVTATKDRNGSPGIATTGGTYTVDEWEFGIARFVSNTSRTAYIKGGASGTNTSSISDFTNANRISIGIRNTTGLPDPFDGDIARSGIWNATLNSDERAALEAGIEFWEIRPANLVFYCELIRDVVELTGNLSLTTVGTTVADHAPVRFSVPSMMAYNAAAAASSTLTRNYYDMLLAA